ncbi:type II toxin-antitoxin system death-on-curing family toxin [Sphingobacterium wenxiniae]|uniref:Death on curing protein n=1 Tax=Sphingobacterium wenxiniae TaxID=683125 RepID=A0A1I6NZ15_9SPHI|nr:type II toxin-antitoxin system death-on-curing family toxin [Sphingobacterium wenxiniae]SFS33159.1 death on curing protein [Sphingobacterium wenxiniae]
MNLIYINHIDDIVRVHDKVIEISGGLSGLKDIGYLESVIYQITNDDYYPEFEDKLTHLVFSINKFHAFQDGNKRASIAVGAQFLELNGFDYVVGRFIKEMENIAVCVADGIIDKDFLGELIYSIIYEDDFEESLKVKLANILLTMQERISLEGNNDDNF